jgi:hypothetical protein
VRLEQLYRIRFSYPEHHYVRAPSFLGAFFAEGRCEGSLSGRFRGMNHPSLLPGDLYVPSFQGVIETEDGATIGFDLDGFGRPRDYGREVVARIVHSTEDERYARLNDALCVVAGEAREKQITLEVAELIWEPVE